MEKEERTELTKKMGSGEFVISVQIDPPADLNPRPFLEKIHTLRSIGVNLVDINSRTVISHDSIWLACLLKQEGLDTIPHITSRPSSVAGLLDQIRSGYAFFGINNYLVITGDDYRHSEVRGVFEADSLGLISAFNYHFRDQQKVDDIAFGAAINQNNPDLKLEEEKTVSKLEAGVDFFMSQPVFNYEQTKGLVNFYRQLSNKPMMVGIWPLIYESMVEKIKAGKIEGVVVPDDVYYQSQQQSDLRNWGLTQAGYLIEDLKHNPDIQGVYIVAPAHNPLHLTELLERVLS